MVVNNQTNSKTMLTDLYQLTMMAAYLDNGKEEDIATFDMFIRTLPENWGYFIANGIEDAVDYIINIEFTEEDIEYLRKQGTFKEEFLQYLTSFKFEGEVYAVKEGTPVFPNEPILRVTAKRSQAQFIESAILNIINFQTMIASKANRIVNAAYPAKIVDFGLRRAQEEDGGMKGARAAYIGGAAATSNVKAGKEYGISISGTHAHSFVMSFNSEIEAFRAYVKTFPNNATLLIDTYDTLQGARNAVIIAKELEIDGKKLGSVRLDSGDLCDLSIKVRKILDEGGLNYVKLVDNVKIFASNDLNEYKIDDLVKNGARIDGYGVGTEMITAKPVAAVSGVYKLVEDEAGAKIKLSSGKKTYPGKKQIYRVENQDGTYAYDVLALENEVLEDEKVEGTLLPLLEQVVCDGKRVRERISLAETREYVSNYVKKLPDKLKKVKVSDKYDKYDVRISTGLSALINSSTERFQAKNTALFSEGLSVKNTIINGTTTSGTTATAKPATVLDAMKAGYSPEPDWGMKYDL
ncbi:nicotinate phosphoribosyltransferase [Candidatus Woesearchaeota archaeon]|nr:nicotinate phosphoribosyltransferase [Candidatus Woesearchaeota archaeon]